MLPGVISLDRSIDRMTEQSSSDWLGLAGRVCVVTGAGGGIGRAVASSLARAGARVAAIDRDERGLEVTDAELRAASMLSHVVILRAPKALPPPPRRP